MTHKISNPGSKMTPTQPAKEVSFLNLGEHKLKARAQLMI